MFPTARRTSGFTSVVLLLALAACGGDGGGGASPEGSPEGVADRTSSPAAGSTAAGVQGTRIDLTVTGGAFAGTHQLTENVACVSEPGNWMVSSTRQGDQGLTQILLLVDDVPATGGSSEEMSLMATFGDPMNDSATNSGTLTLDPVAGEGTGSATVRRDGRAAVLEVNGTTAEGARVSAVVRCESVAGSQ
jgi:hypothetical protein